MDEDYQYITPRSTVLPDTVDLLWLEYLYSAPLLMMRVTSGFMGVGWTKMNAVDIGTT